MRIKVRSSDSLTYDLEISPKETCLDVKRLVSEKAEVAVGRIRLIYQGRILNQDEQKLVECGIQNEHTIHLIIQQEAPPSPPSAHVRETTLPLSSTREAFAREIAAHDAATAALLSNLRHGREPRVTGLREHLLMVQRADDIREQMILARGVDQYSADHAVLQREYGNAEILLGIMIGFLLGFLAGICLIDAHVSRRLKLGIFLGLISNVGLGLMRMAMMQSISDTNI